MSRAFLIGAVFSIVIGFISPYTVIAIQPMSMSADFITAGAIFCLLFIVGILNPILKLLKDPLSPRELILIYSMMIAASAVPCWGFMLNLIPIISGLFYFASPENEWAELIHPYLKDFLVPQVILFCESQPLHLNFDSETIPDWLACPKRISHTLVDKAYKLIREHLTKPARTFMIVSLRYTNYELKPDINPFQSDGENALC